MIVSGAMQPVPDAHARALPQRIAFAKTKSDAVAKVDGSFKPSKSERSKKNAAARGMDKVAWAWIARGTWLHGHPGGAWAFVFAGLVLAKPCAYCPILQIT